MKNIIKSNVTGKYQIIKEGPNGREEYNFHNIACKNFIVPNKFGRYDSFADTRLQIGDGTGTPAITDTALFNCKWTIYPKSDWASVENVDINTSRFTYTYELPATSDYVGNITEVGMYAVCDGLIFTHALVSDAEGNPITIDKKIDDVLTIKIVFEMHTSLPAYISDNIEHYVEEHHPNFATYLLSKRFYAYQTASLLRYDLPYYARDAVSLANMYLGIRPCNAIVIGGRWQIQNDPAGGNAWEYALNDMTMHNNNTIRLAASSPFNGHYYMYAQLMINGDRDKYYATLPIYIDLRKSGIFTPQEITGIPLITGDGEKTTFIMPFNYFQKDTEKVYKNGIQLTKDTDYTVNNAANIAGMQEIMFITSSDPTKINIYTKEEHKRGSNPIQFFPDYITDSNITEKIGSKNMTYGFTHEDPLLIDWGEPRTCNTLRGNLCYQQTCYGGTGYDCVIEYANSIDGPWYEAARTASMPDDAYNMDINLSWPNIKAQYWRITPNCKVPTDDAYFMNSNTTDDNGYALKMFFGYSSAEGITFTSAPLATDKLTMDCKSDVLFKNDKFAFAMNLDISISYN